MKYYDAIKGMYNIPKRYSCNETYCINCKEDLSCYKHWLDQEVPDYRDICEVKK